MQNVQMTQEREIVSSPYHVSEIVEFLPEQLSKVEAVSAFQGRTVDEVIADATNLYYTLFGTLSNTELTDSEVREIVERHIKTL